MVTAPKIRCVVVLAGAETDGMPERSRSRTTRPRFRPSDLLPWADPHIRSLVEQLQEEVREEETLRREAVESDAAAFRDAWDASSDDRLAEPAPRRF